MSQAMNAPLGDFVDRRNPEGMEMPPVLDRRQFTNGYEELSPEGRELAQSVDAYKLHHRRRFVTYDEILAIVKSLGYHK